MEHITVKANVKNVSEEKESRLKFCKVQGKYAGKVTDVHKGVVYVRLTNGVDAIAHSCMDRRMPGKKDDVSYGKRNLRALLTLHILLSLYSKCLL